MSSSGVSFSLKEGSISAIRYITFLDIMGFKDRVSRENFDEIYEVLKNLADHIRYEKERLSDNLKIEHTQFSDSIILYTSDCTPESLLALSKLTQSIFLEAIKNGIPLKGAISKGMATCDVRRQLYFGQPFIDSYLLEENVNYYGVVVHHTAEEDVVNLGNQSLYEDQKIPLKSGEINHYHLKWYEADSSDPSHKTEVINHLKKVRLSVSDSPRRYIDNTLRMINAER